jgi:hypothetical protein
VEVGEVGTGLLTRVDPGPPDARQLQRTPDQTSRLCLTAVEPRDQQDRTAQAAAAAVRAVELLDGEQTRRTCAAKASVRG